MNHKAILIIISLISLIFPSKGLAATHSAAEIMQKASSLLLKGGGIKATYTLKTGGQTQQGTLTVKGRKFSVLTKSMCTWYDGKTLWDYNAVDNEVTVSNPTSADIATLNPYVLLSSYKTEYTAQLVTGTVKGTYNVRLTPKNAHNPVRSAVLCLRASNYQPVRLDVTLRTGVKSSIIITNVKSGLSLSDSSFKYPAKKYPKAQVIDLR